MKKIFNFTMFLGIIIIIGGAGGYETQSATFSQSLVIMLSGASLMILSAYGKDKYLKRMRKLARMRKRKIAVQMQGENLCREIA